MGTGKRQQAIRAMRGQMRSPGRPPVARREHRQRFWAAIARGAPSEDAAVEAGVRRRGPAGADRGQPDEDEAGAATAESNGEEDSSWTEALLARSHRLSPAGFEEFTLYLLHTFGLELTRVGGVGDEGIDGIGLAPISAVLSSRVAVQAKRHDPTATIGRDVVALFQRDAAAAGAERAQPHQAQLGFEP